MQNSLNLTEIWRRTERFQAYPGNAGEMIFLHVKSDERPANFLTRDQWFMTCQKSRDEAGYWEVGIWGKYLDRVDEFHRAAATDIMTHAKAHFHFLAEKQREFEREQEESRKAGNFSVKYFDPSPYWTMVNEDGPREAASGPS